MVDGLYKVDDNIFKMVELICNPSASFSHSLKVIIGSSLIRMCRLTILLGVELSDVYLVLNISLKTFLNGVYSFSRKVHHY